MRPPPYPKKIEKLERLFYYYKIDPSNYSLFDSDMNTPIICGSYNLVAAKIANLPPTSTIFYFELHPREGWKMKRIYKPTLASEESGVAKERIDSKKETG